MSPQKKRRKESLEKRAGTTPPPRSDIGSATESEAPVSEAGLARPRAILIVGPSGSGKSPLGDYLEENGFLGRRCVHFDFGANLRKAARNGPTPGLLSDNDIGVVVRALKAGALLEDSNFHIARSILDSFVRSRKLGEHDVVLLNGLPRHLGQATAIDELVNIRLVVYLDCMPGTLSQRIGENVAGDRTGRDDDSPAAIACKFRVFQVRTLPLLNFYRRQGTRVVTVKVRPQTTATEIAAQMAEAENATQGEW